jgi:hypothetical protein
VFYSYNISEFSSPLQRSDIAIEGQSNESSRLNLSKPSEFAIEKYPYKVL